MRESFGTAAGLFPATVRPVVTIGVFDGVHHGHQTVLAATRAKADATGQPSAVLTFDVHPRTLLFPESAPPLITSLKHRLILFREAGINGVCVLPFNRALAELSAEMFIRDILVGQLHASTVILGYDTHFGANRLGDLALLESSGAAYDLTAHALPPTELNGEIISSTAIRKAVQGGALAKAATMLGRPVSILGTVISGRGIGRPLGFPTLNLNPHHELRPPTGVYITITRCGDTTWQSVTNIGRRPSLPAEGHGILVETHLLDYSGDLYGQTVEVMFQEKLREETRFANRDELARQINQDVTAARSWFAVH